MATTRQIARQLEELLDIHGDEIKVSSNFGDARFEVIAQRVDVREIKYLAGGPEGLYLSLALQKDQGHWKVVNSDLEQADKLLMNRMFEVSYRVLQENVTVMDYLDRDRQS